MQHMVRSLIAGLGLAASVGLHVANAEPIQPYQAQSIQPYQARSIQPYQAQSIQPYQATAVQPGRASTVDARTPAAPVDDSVFFHVFTLAMPGVAYTTDDLANDVRWLHSGVGALNGALEINPDGTYVWQSPWDQRVISGTWQPTTYRGYALVLQNGQSGIDWFVYQQPNGLVTIADDNAFAYYAHVIQ